MGRFEVADDLLGPSALDADLEESVEAFGEVAAICESLSHIKIHEVHKRFFCRSWVCFAKLSSKVRHLKSFL